MVHDVKVFCNGSLRTTLRIDVAIVSSFVLFEVMLQAVRESYVRLYNIDLTSDLCTHYDHREIDVLAVS
jgi:hypothetical protein